MNEALPRLIYWAGFLQLSVLVGSALVPVRLNWKEAFKPLAPLLRQMYWVYGGYIVLSIVALGMISIFNSEELAGGTRLARSVCAYGMVFWGVRLSLQAVLDVKEYLVVWWLRTGYYALTVIFLTLTVIYGYGTFHIS